MSWQPYSLSVCQPTSAGMCTVALGHDLDDARALAPPGSRRKRVVAARTEAARPAVLVIGQDLGMIVDQPFRRRRGRRAEHDLQPGRPRISIGRSSQPKSNTSALRARSATRRTRRCARRRCRVRPCGGRPSPSGFRPSAPDSSRRQALSRQVPVDDGQAVLVEQMAGLALDADGQPVARLLRAQGHRP